MKAIANRVREDRLRREMTQKQYAELTGLSQPFIAQVETGARGLGVEAFMKLCQALGWAPEYLYYGKGEKMSEAKTALEAELLAAFRAVPVSEQRKIIKMVRAATDDDSGNIDAA